MTLAADLQSLTPGQRIVLFEVDATAFGGSIYRFHDGTNGAGGDITWQGNAYARYPVKAEGFAGTTEGSQPRPKLIISNALGLVGGLVRDLDDLVGARVIRKQTLAQYLDGMPDADPSQHLDDEVWVVERKIEENKENVAFELATPLDVHGLKVPSAIMQASVCIWNDASICTYSVGGVCDKTLDGPAGCKFHWGATAELPFGAFPGISRIR